MAPDIHALPSPFYRVAVKALIFDDQKRLLVLRNGKQKWELPGGGLEHGEDVETCLQRELQEEIGVEADTISPLLFVFEGVSSRGWHVLRLVVMATIPHNNLTPSDGLTAAKYATKDELLLLPISRGDDGILLHVNKIWPAAA